ncbi:hypothetical protein, partial [Shigella sonnei]
KTLSISWSHYPQMVFNVYGAWMKDNNHEQIELLNKRLSESVPCMPHKKVG